MMIADLKPYPAMKDSSAPWLGDVPEHWEVRRIKTLFREKDERSGNGRGVLLSLTRAHGIVPQAEASKRMASAEDLSMYKVCRQGDLVMNRMQAWSGMFALSSRDGLVSPDYSVFGTIGPAEVKYFELLFKTPVLVDQFAQRSKGIGSGFNRLYTPDFGAVPVTIPPVLEQSAIVHFLDHANRRIRRYVSAKQKLIKLLEEQKEVIINRAVTRGLDPNVRLKPSGMEWLGDVPEHWTVHRLKFVCNDVTVGVVVNPSSYFADEGVPFLLGNNVGPGAFKLSDVRRISEASNRLLRKSQLNAGDVVVVRVGAPGVAAVIPPKLEGANCASMVILRSGSTVEPHWIEYVFNSPITRRQIDIVKYGAAQKQFNVSHAVNFLLPVPPRKEQRAILSALEYELKQTVSAVFAASAAIDLLREYRTRLIADVVTGKLDVRDAAAKLPDEASEAERLDEIEDVLQDESVAEDIDIEAADAA